MSTWFKFWKKPEDTASVARDRLQAIVSRERTSCGPGAGGFLPQGLPSMRTETRRLTVHDGLPAHEQVLIGQYGLFVRHDVPLDHALREGTVATVTTGMLPEAEFVFLDELFNANSAILNNLLTVLNERVYRRGAETHRLPLLSLFSASNHLR